MSKSKNKKKDNFNQAMFEMFGIGKDGSAEVEEPEETEESTAFFDDEPLAEPAMDPFIQKEPELTFEAPRKTRTTFLAEGTSIEGTLRCDSDVEICGDFKGELIANGKIILHANTTSNVQASDLSLVGCNLTGDATVSKCITIDENSTITGGVSAEEVICSGVVRGNMNITDNLTLNTKAKVFGDIHTGSLVIERGARVTGKIEMAAQ